MQLSHIINKDGQAIPVKIIGDAIGGGVSGYDVETGSLISKVSFEVDPEGYAVQRIVDAAPNSYDPSLDAKRTVILADKKIQKNDYTANETVAAGGNSLLEIKPPPGKVWEVENLFFRYPSITGATGGTHSVTFRYGDNISFCGVLRGITAYNKIIDYVYGSFASTVDTKMPSLETLQSESIKGLHLTEEAPLFAYYQNQTDAPTSGARPFYLVVSEKDAL